MNLHRYIVVGALALASYVQNAHPSEPAGSASAAPLATPATAEERAAPTANGRPDGVVTDTGLSKRWLKGERQRNKPTLVIGRHDADALLVGFQARGGKRLLFRSAYLPNGDVVSEALHWNPASGRIERLFVPSTDIDPSTGKLLRDFKVNGVNVLSHLKAKRDKLPGHENSQRKVSEFLDTEEGDAFLAAVPAMYAALEDDETSDRQPKLKKPFAMWAMMVQVSGERYKGLPDAEFFANSEKRRALQESCANGSCQMRGKSFVIHGSGLFDVISKPRNRQIEKKQISVLSRYTLQSSQIAAPPLGSGKIPPIQSVNTDSPESCRDQRDNPVNPANACFGKCGTGCGVIEPKLPECIAHDFCVCVSSHTACLVSIPPECDENPEDCGTLLSAIIAVSQQVFVTIFNLLAFSIGEIAALVFGVVEFTFGFVYDIVSSVLGMIGDFLDWLLGDDDCDDDEEISATC
jgi:hypothetical protein